MFGSMTGNLSALRKGIISFQELEHDARKIEGILRGVDEPLLIMVMGEFSTGKSTFINALVEREITIVGEKPTTAVITKLCYGLEDQITVFFKDGTQQQYSVDVVLCQDLKQIKMRTFQRQTNICFLSNVCAVA